MKDLKTKKRYYWKFKYTNGAIDKIGGSCITKTDAINCAVTLMKFLLPNHIVDTNSFQKVYIK